MNADLPDFLTTDDGGFIHLAGHRIGMHHVVRLYNDGYSPEMLAEAYPTLPLALIHKTIAFYLENRDAVDGYMAEHDAAIERQSAAAASAPSVLELRQRLEAKRRAEAS